MLLTLYVPHGILVSGAYTCLDGAKSHMGSWRLKIHFDGQIKVLKMTLKKMHKRLQVEDIIKEIKVSAMILF